MPPKLDTELVSRLADAFLRDTVRAMDAVPGVAHMIAYDPPDAVPYFSALDPNARLVPQVGASFGPRLSGALGAAFAIGAKSAVVMVGDAPHLDPAWIERAFVLLADHDMAFGPGEDGGYYLLGLNRACPRVFEDITWSTSLVAGQTLERAREAGLSVGLLPAEFDVDGPADLERLRRLIEKEGAARCPNTARVLAGLPLDVPTGDR
jgi:rSAM/selenodomain-associated transferase 1